MPLAVSARLRRWWAPKVAPEATPQAVEGAPQAVSARLRRRLICASEGAASGVGNVVGHRWHPMANG
jgi:hypothetical protein